MCSFLIPIIMIIIKFSTSDNAFRLLWLVHSISVISSYTLVWPYLVNDCAKLKMFSPESEIFLWIKLKKKKKTFSGKFGSMPTFRSTRKGKKCFLWWAYVCLNTRCYVQHRIFIKFFFPFRSDFLAFFARISYFKVLEFKEFNKTIIPFALVGYETGYSQLGATRLVGYSPFHIQRALME